MIIALGTCSAELRRQLDEDRAQSQQLLAQEADSRERVEAESAATKEAVEEAIKDLEQLDAERTQLRHKLQARSLCLCTAALLTWARAPCGGTHRRHAYIVFAAR